MKNHYRSSCGCSHRPLSPGPSCGRPSCPEDDRPSCPQIPFPPGCGGFLMQRIIASGRLHRRRECTRLCLDDLPAQAQPPFTAEEVWVNGPPQWDEMPCRQWQGMGLRVRIPLGVRLRDGCGSLWNTASVLEEELPLRFQCPQWESWRGQPFVQAAVRLAGRPCPCDGRRCEVPLEILIDGYILSPCALGRPDQPACPPSIPWYPQPIR